MKKKKKILIGICVILILLILFRGPIFRITVEYNIIGEREVIELVDSEVIKELEQRERLTLEEIIILAKKITNEKLSFSTGKVSGNPNEVLKEGKANCIGYSALFSSIIDFLIDKQNDRDKIRTKHLIGKIEFFGVDIHQFSEHPFFRDHDFNSIENLDTGEIIYFDPSVSDYLKIEKISCK